MEINRVKFASAGSLTMGIIYIVCRIFVSIAPSAVSKLLSLWIHMFNIEQLTISPNFTISAFVSGLLSAMILSYIAVWIFAAIYNKLVSRKI